MRYAVALPRVYVSWPRRNESLPKRPILPNLASPDSCCPRGVTIATFYRAFVPVSLVQIVLLKIVSLELRFCPAYPVESLIVPFFPLFFFPPSSPSLFCIFPRQPYGIPRSILFLSIAFVYFVTELHYCGIQ